MKQEYFARFDGIHTETSQVTRFDERTDLSTTYLHTYIQALYIAQ